MKSAYGTTTKPCFRLSREDVTSFTSKYWNPRSSPHSNQCFVNKRSLFTNCCCSDCILDRGLSFVALCILWLITHRCNFCFAFSRFLVLFVACNHCFRDHELTSARTWLQYTIAILNPNEIARKALVIVFGCVIRFLLSSLSLHREIKHCLMSTPTGFCRTFIIRASAFSKLFKFY